MITSPQGRQNGGPGERRSQVFYVDRVTIARRQQEMLCDAANERLSMSARPRPGRTSAGSTA